MEQEAQLKRKQDLIDRRRSNQRARMDYLERNGEFPKDPDDNDAGSVFSVPDTGSECEGRVERLDLERCFSEEEIHRVGDREEVHRGVTGKGEARRVGDRQEVHQGVTSKGGARYRENLPCVIL